MTIDEAIKVLGNEIRVAEVNDHPREVRALKLGIEALKLVKDMRDWKYWGCPKLLPGETKE